MCGIIKGMEKKAILLLCCFQLTGCAVVASMGGGSAATIQAAQTIDAAKLSADALSGAATGKTITDHAISYVADQDCTLFNLLDSKPMCVEYGSKQKVEELASNQPSTPVPVLTINPVTLQRSAP
jgi:hypothetical protein